LINNRQRAKPLLSHDGLFNRRYESNFEWGHDTKENFRGVKGTDWTRDHGFTFADDFNTLERDTDDSYHRPNVRNCRYCLNTYPDTEPHNVLENGPITEIEGCNKCHPENYINDHHEGKDDFYPVKSDDPVIASSENLNLHHNTRNCHSNPTTTTVTTKEKITRSSSATFEEQPDWKSPEDTLKKNKNSNDILSSWIKIIPMSISGIITVEIIQNLI